MLTAPIARGALALLAAGLVAVDANGPSPVAHEASRFQVSLPAAWSKTLLLDCRGEPNCLAEARFAREDGAWLRVVVDPPGPAHGVDVALRLAVNADGTLRPETLPTGGQRRVVSIGAGAAGHEYLLLLASGNEDDVRSADLDAIVQGFRVRWQDDRI